MKHSHIVIAYALTLSGAAFSQSSEGLFITSDDFANNRLFYADKRTHLYLHELSGKNRVDLRHNDSLFSFSKSQVYGYCDAEGDVSRFFEGRAYRLVNRGERIPIYVVSSGTGLKNSPQADSYFFSRDATSPVLPLSLSNVLACFPDNSAFSLLLEIYYKNESDLCNYDPVHGMYKLNRLLDLSQILKTD